MAPVVRAEVPKDVLEEVKAAFEKKLPVGWTVRVDGEKQRIEIERVGKVLQNPIPVPNAMHGQQESPKLERFVVALEVADFVSIEEYKKRREENRRISEELAAMYKSMRGIPHKFDSFIPSNDEEREQVRSYEELKGKRHSLPEYFYREKVSLVPSNWIQLGGGIEGATVLIVDEGVRRRVREDLGAAFSVLGRYWIGEDRGE